MTPAFEPFINEKVIPQNWKILSKRFDVSTWTIARQRMKIIGEIVEFYEAMENYHATKTPHNLELLGLELADIIISCCTLISLQGEGRTFRFTPVNHENDTLGWIRLVCARSTNTLISSVANFGTKMGIEVESVIQNKLDFNRTRKDWS